MLLVYQVTLPVYRETNRHQFDIDNDDDHNISLVVINYVPSVWGSLALTPVIQTLGEHAILPVVLG